MNMTDEAKHLHLFQGYGIELEYMIVDSATLDVRPESDQLLFAAGGPEGDVEDGDLGWSNELVLHVIELKTNGPAPRLDTLPASFQVGIDKVNGMLAPGGARLMPTAMHPWMEPAREARLWPHANGPVYSAFDRIFGCSGHGWSNLQSMHLNLPFANDAEFGRLHTAIRMVLPILPALAASSPIVELKRTPVLDNRLEFYRKNSARVPSVSGSVIPEPAETRAGYERDILGRIYKDLAPLDPEGVLRHEWANARGAIARFDRYAIEIRVLDVQETPRADLAIAAAIVAVLQALIDSRWVDFEDLRAWPVEPLAQQFLKTLAEGERAPIEDERYLAAFGIHGNRSTAGDLWRHLLQTTLFTADASTPWREPLELILEEGPLARRILRRLGVETSAPADGERLDRSAVSTVYHELCACLAEGRLFRV